MVGQNGGMDFGAMLQGAGRQLFNQGGQALVQYGAQAIGNIINEVFQKKEVEQKRFLPSIKNYKVLGETRPSSFGPATYQDFKDIRSRCLAEGRLFEDPEFPAIDRSLYYKERLDRPITWLRPSEISDDPQLFVDGYSRFDVQQGDLGDCWLLAAVANLTLYRKLFFQVVPDDQSFDEDYAGVFHFRFWQYGRWVDVVIDDRLPTYRGKLVFLHSSMNNEFWSALLEKAYAKLHGSYEALKGGSTCEAMEDFTGGVTEMYEVAKLPPNFYTILLKAYERNSLMGCSIEPDPNILEAKTPVGLIRGHAYSVTRVKYVDIETPGRAGKILLLRLRNPWGNAAEWNGPWSDKSLQWRFIPESEKEELGLTFDDDGEFWMAFEDFVTHFSRVEICNLNPDSLDPEECPEGCTKKWEMSVFEGEWVRGVTAGGCRNYLETFWKNPQYTVTLKDVDEGDDENKCTIIVALMQKNRRSQRHQGLECLTIGFAVYRLPDYGHVPKPLDVNFFKYNASVGRSQAFINLREVSARFKFEPGSYVIVPSTFDQNEEGEFLLRVFSEKCNNMAENDEDIGMGEVDDRVKEIAPNPEPADPVRDFFTRLAGADGEVDWQELKEILDYAMREGHWRHHLSAAAVGAAAAVRVVIIVGALAAACTCCNKVIPAMFHTASIWLTLSLAVQRYIYVCHAPVARTWCTMPRVMKCLIYIGIAAFLHQLPRFFDRQYVPHVTFWRGHLEQVCRMEMSPWVKTLSMDVYFITYFVFRVLFVHLIPCTSLVVLNVLLFRAMRTAQINRQKLFKENRKSECKRLRDSNCTTLMLIVVVTVFLMVEIPVAVVTILHIISSTIVEILDYHIANILILITNFFIIVSYPINFAIYCGMSRQFRETFKELFIRGAVTRKNGGSSRYSLVNGPRTCTNETVL